jgi:hypothetical protein
MMQAELKRLHSPDVQDLKNYHPEEPDNFGFLLQAMIGPAGGEGEESFDMVVCTPEWINRNHAGEIVLGRHHVIVFEYNYERLAGYIAAYAQECTGETWQEVAQLLGRLGKWEFEDYRESVA